MQRYMTLIMVGVLLGGLLVLGPTAAPFLDGAPSTGPGPPVVALEPTESTSSPPTTLTARSLLGVPVTTADGVRLGQLDDVFIEPTEGRVTLVVISATRWFGLSGRFVVLPWPTLRLAANGSGIVVEFGSEQPSSLP